MDFACTVDFADDSATITAKGEMDVGATSQLRDMLQLAAGRAGIRSVLVELSGVTFMDSSALGVLVAAKNASQRRQTSFAVLNPGPMVAMVLNITGLYDQLVHPTPAPA
jgi:anti-sigma B factor antagonist